MKAKIKAFFKHQSKEHSAMVNAYFKFWDNWFNYQGCASRSDYWYMVLWDVVAFLICSVLNEMVIELTLFNRMFSIVSIIYGVLFLCYWLGVFIASISLDVRRLHDVNLSGWLIIPLKLISFGMMVVGIIPSNPDSKYRN